MFTLDTQILTTDGLIEAWKVFPGDELLDENSNVHTVKDVQELRKTVFLLTLEDETEIKVSETFIDKKILNIYDNLILKNPISIVGLENSRPDYQPVLPIDGLEFGNYSKYNSIPFYYIMNTVENRKAFLQGLFFSQLLVKHNDINNVILLVSSNEFAENILYLVRSLGGTGYYHMFYSEQEYFEITIDLPAYFNEGNPSRLITKIEKLEEENVLKFISEQDNFVINHFTVIPNIKGDLSEQKNTN